MKRAVELPQELEQFYKGEEHRPFILNEGREGGALVIHGFMGTPDEMRPLAHALSALHYHVDVLGLPGFAQDIAQLPRVRSADWWRECQVGWSRLAQTAYRPKVVVGFSMGGAVAIQLAAHASADALILIAPFTRLNDPLAPLVPFLRWFVPHVKPFSRIDLKDEKFREQFSQFAPHINLEDPSVVHFLRHEVRLPMHVLVELIKVGRKAGRKAKQVHCPTLIIQGTEDSTVLPKDTRHLLKQFGGPVEYHELIGRHDIVRLTQSDYSVILQNFLSQLPTSDKK